MHGCDIAMTKKLFISAFNIHQGGGLYLLRSLIKAVDPNRKCLLILDKRLSADATVARHHKVQWISPTILHRLNVNKWLFKNTDYFDTVLCFGNLPPLIKLKGRVIVFVQNRYLIDHVALSQFPFKDQIRLFFERLWFSMGMRNASLYIVQTLSMKQLLEKKLGNQVPIRVCPFVADSNGYKRDSLDFHYSKNNIYDFVYVASGEPHKNHLRLLEAWKLLAQEGIYPSLCLTLDGVRSMGLCRRLEDLSREYGLRISNIGSVAHEEILALYNKSGAVIYPSKFESLGLPLIEARQAGLPVLAPELDYVRDVLDPEQVFNPDSPTSIARAVKRHMGIGEVSLPLMGAPQFLNMLLEGDVQ